MLTATTDGAAKMLTFIVSNASFVGSTGRFSVTLPADSMLVALHEAVSLEARLVPGTFELRDSNPRGGSSNGQWYRLDDAGVHTSSLLQAGMTNKQRLWICPVNGDVHRQPVSAESSDADALRALGTVALWNTGQPTPIAGLSQGLGALGTGNATGAVLGGAANTCGFVGLVNQGATCYLSSVLQSLFMTPEFRQIVFAWRPRGAAADAGATSGGGGGEADGEATLAAASATISVQLQRLFVALSDGMEANNRAEAEHRAAAGAAPGSAGGCGMAAEGAGEGRAAVGGAEPARAAGTAAGSQSQPGMDASRHGPDASMDACRPGLDPSMDTSHPGLDASHPELDASLPGLDASMDASTPAATPGTTPPTTPSTPAASPAVSSVESFGERNARDADTHLTATPACAPCPAFRPPAVASVVRAIDTRELTQSFGWSAADAFEQHDVLELLHVLVDALEGEHRDTPLVRRRRGSGRAHTRVQRG